MAGYIGSLPVVNWFDSLTGLKGDAAFAPPTSLIQPTMFAANHPRSMHTPH
jgi:hypothetical protein